MELKDHLSILNKYKWLIIFIVVVTTAVAFFVSFYQTDYYKVSTSFTVKAINKPVTTEYQYDGYYAIKASELFSQTVISWFLTPSVLVNIYDMAGIDPQITSLEKFTSRFTTKQYSAQNFVVSFKERDKTTAEKVANSIISYVEENSLYLNQDSDQNSLFEVEGSSPVIIKSKTPTWLVTLAAFVLGFVISLCLGYFVNYLKKEGVGRQDSDLV